MLKTQLQGLLIDQGLQAAIGPAAGRRGLVVGLSVGFVFSPGYPRGAITAQVQQFTGLQDQGLVCRCIRCG